MTAKERIFRWEQRSQDPKNTFWHRVTVKVLSGLILSGITVTIIFIIELRDAVKDYPKQKKDIEILKTQSAAVKQKINLILLNDENFNVHTEKLRPIFNELDHPNER